MGDSYDLKKSDFDCILYFLHPKPFYWKKGYEKNYINQIKLFVILTFHNAVLIHNINNSCHMIEPT